MKRLFGRLLNYFFKGLLIVLPLVLSGYVIVWGISRIDSIVDLGFPGAGIAIVLVSITLAGVFVTRFVTTPMEAWFDRQLDRLPLFKLMYSSIRDLMEAFVGEEKKFNEPVLATLNEFGLKRIGFVTQKDLSKLGLPGDVAVYFPFSYTFSGELLILPADKITYLKMNPADAMKFAVSGGVSELE